jgi:transcriptional regulator with XRE-family HTH domain
MIIMLISGIAWQHKLTKEAIMTFGETISDARKKTGLSQKDLAAQIKKEDGTPISPQYLNDIERDRRNPPSDYILQQLADALGLSQEYLSFLAGQYPSDLREINPSPERVEKAFQAFRKTLKGE